MSTSQHPNKTRFTRTGIRRGFILTAPIAVSAFGFGGAFGALAAQNGFTWLEAVFMSLFVFAGASQMVALDLWVYPLPVLTMALVIGTVNSRFILESASIQPWLKEMPGPNRKGRIFFGLFTLTDASWALAMDERSKGETDLGVFLGSSALLYLVWNASTVFGYFLGTLISDPKVYGLDLVLPAFFTTMLVPLCQKSRHLAPLLVSLICSIVLSQTTEGFSYLLISALAGCLTAVVLYKAPKETEGA